jgi:hypothetical protein
MKENRLNQELNQDKTYAFEKHNLYKLVEILFPHITEEK